MADQGVRDEAMEGAIAAGTPASFRFRCWSSPHPRRLPASHPALPPCTSVESSGLHSGLHRADALRVLVEVPVNASARGLAHR